MRASFISSSHLASLEGKEEEALTSMYFPKRDELSFLVVFAFPKASMIGFVASICLSTSLIPASSPESATPPGPTAFWRWRRTGRFGSSTDAK